MRVSLNGYDDAIPKSFFDSGLVPDTSLGIFLEDGVPFEKADYIAMGYTHFQAWCVGAAGGKGGSILGGINLVDSLGGAGGGGGLHRVAGLLADLPDSCPVVIGQAGADGVNGEGMGSDHPWPWLFNSWDPDPDYVYPTDGEDGGFSSFNDGLCRASGGTGGGPTQAPPFPSETPSLDDWDVYAARVNIGRLGGIGGQGGCGDRTDPGEGALGGFVLRTEGYNVWDYTPAHDGTWDGVIGKGGGGGSGGHIVMGSGELEILQKAGNGGHGSFSYRDATVYGSREKAYADPPIGRGRVIFPGSGGGARVNKLARYGSRAEGAEPNGAVFIRLIQVD